jgi:quercetin dioxygenase-like cupin family protein
VPKIKNRPVDAFLGPSLDEMSGARSEQYVVPSCTAEGKTISWLASPSGYSLGMAVAELQDGASLHWGQHPHGDEAVYVQEGSLECDGKDTGPGGIVIIEAGATAAATARNPARTKIVHAFPYHPGPDTAGTTPGTHVLTAAQAAEYKDDDGKDLRVTSRFADSNCPAGTCTINIFYQSFGRHHDTISHSHKTDELMMITGGEIRVGPHTIVPGMTVGIPAWMKYSVRSGPIGWAFLNYRAEQPGLEVSDSQRALGRAPTEAELHAGHA